MVYSPEEAEKLSVTVPDYSSNRWWGPETARSYAQKLGFEVESLEVYNMDITTMQMVLRAPAGVVEIVDGVVAGKSSVYRLAK